MTHASRAHTKFVSTLHTQIGHEQKNELKCGSYFTFIDIFDANEMYAHVLVVYYSSVMNIEKEYTSYIVTVRSKCFSLTRSA